MDVRGIGTMMLVPTLLEKGELTWCQDYSEPGAQKHSGISYLI
jgi:hypothetical protein